MRNHGIEVRTHDVVLRYLRVRVGDDNVHLDAPGARETYYDGAGEHALYFIEGSKNCIADHLSLSWSTTKILSISQMCGPDHGAMVHPERRPEFRRPRSRHGIIGQGRLTIHHNLIAHNQSRNPRFA